MDQALAAWHGALAMTVLAPEFESTVETPAIRATLRVVESKVSEGVLGLPFAAALDVHDGVNRHREVDIRAFHEASSPSACQPWPGHREASEAAPQGKSRFLRGSEKRTRFAPANFGGAQTRRATWRKQRLAVPQWRGQAIGRPAHGPGHDQRRGVKAHTLGIQD